MTLDKARRGQRLKIISLPDELTRAQAIRFGIPEGTVVTCREVVPAGPIVIARNRQEIAIGRKLARLISVQPLPEGRKRCTGEE
ncbi:MAG: ferrous iron transport protein A [Peptococcaceae bacterium]|nr:ferrous iron transport protein A [Peptococcaceae bacterium]